MEKRREFELLLMMSETETLMHVADVLALTYGEIVTDYNNYVVAIGTSPIALVAHVDTVSWGTKGMTLAWNKNVLRNEEGVLGADDRAGVFGILEVISKAKRMNLPLPTIIFTNHEESGGRGVKQFIKDQIITGEGINLFVELDRKGCNEYVYYTSSLPKQVKEYVESFGYCQKEGSYSDIMDLAFAYKIPAVNLSVGYYAQHSQHETLHWDEMWLTINRVVEMLADPIPVLYRLSETDCRSWAGGYSYRGGAGMYDSELWGMGTGYNDYYDTYSKKVITLPARNTTPTVNEKEWPITEDDVINNGWDGEIDPEELQDVSELEFMDVLKVEVYCAVLDKNIDDLYFQYMNEVKVVAFLDNFFDFFDHELYKQGYAGAEEILDKDLDPIFESTWNLVSNVYGSKL